MKPHLQDGNYVAILIRAFDSPNQMGVSDIDAWIDKLKRSILPSENEIKILCGKVRELLVEESNVQVIYAPVVVSLTFTETSAYSE